MKLSKAPPLGSTYYIPCLGRRGLTAKLKWEGSEFDYTRLARGIVHLSQMSALKQASCIISNVTCGEG